MKMWTYITLSLVLASAWAADDRECLAGLARCKDQNIYAIDKLTAGADIAKVKEGCELYASALMCLDTVSCRNTDAVKATRKIYRRELYDKVAGGCTPEGTIDKCYYKLVDCAVEFEEVQTYLTDKSAMLCSEVEIFNRCADKASDMCPSEAMKDLVNTVYPVNAKTSAAGCDGGCQETLTACVYMFAYSTEAEYCKSYDAARNCLAKAREHVNCSSDSSQEYLDAAVTFRGSKYLSLCNGASSTLQMSTLLVLPVLFMAVFTKIFN